MRWTGAHGSVDSRRARGGQSSKGPPKLPPRPRRGWSLDRSARQLPPGPEVRRRNRDRDRTVLGGTGRSGAALNRADPRVRAPLSISERDRGAVHVHRSPRSTAGLVPPLARNAGSAAARDGEAGILSGERTRKRNRAADAISTLPTPTRATLQREPETLTDSSGRLEPGAQTGTSRGLRALELRSNAGRSSNRRHTRQLARSSAPMRGANPRHPFRRRPDEQPRDENRDRQNGSLALCRYAVRSAADRRHPDATVRSPSRDAAAVSGKVETRVVTLMGCCSQAACLRNSRKKSEARFAQGEERRRLQLRGKLMRKTDEAMPEGRPEL